MKTITYIVNVKAPLYTSPERSFTDYNKARSRLYDYMEKARAITNDDFGDAIGTIVMHDASAVDKYRETLLMKINGDFYNDRQEAMTNISTYREEDEYGL